MKVHGVIKHRAPNGALRRHAATAGTVEIRGNKAPSAKQALRHGIGEDLTVELVEGYIAPSAKRCIKTHRRSRRARRWKPVIKHRAPNGELRLVVEIPHQGLAARVIKHRAPNGALRPVVHRAQDDSFLGS